MMKMLLCWGKPVPFYNTIFFLVCSFLSPSLLRLSRQTPRPCHAQHCTGLRPGEAGAFRLVGRTTLQWRPWMGWAGWGVDGVDGPRWGLRMQIDRETYRYTEEEGCKLAY